MLLSHQTSQSGWKPAHAALFGRVSALGRVSLGQIVAILILLHKRAVDGFLENRFRIVDLKLGLEVSGTVGKAAAVGAAASIGKGEILIHDLIGVASPVTTATAILLDLLWVGVDIAALGEKARKILLSDSSAVGNALVVTIVGLVGASHVDDKSGVERWRKREFE